MREYNPLGSNTPDLTHFFFFLEFLYEKLTILLNRYVDDIKSAYSTVY